MEKKPIMIMATTLIALLVLTPIAQAGVVHFWWDNVSFVAGTDIDYAHPDNIYYGISPSSDWIKLGDDLHHHQINRGTTTAIVIGTVLIVDVLLVILFRHLPQTPTAYYVAGLGGIVLSTFIGIILDYYFVDERGCMWLWIGSLFMAYLLANLDYLGGMYQDVALALILSAFVCYGYFRIGQVTFHDPLGIGSPSPPTLSLSATSGGTTSPAPGTYTYSDGQSVTVSASEYSGYDFNHWLLDGVTKYSNPITVTMNSDHTLIAYFQSSGAGNCPTLFVWDGSDYAEEGVLDIHAESDVTVHHEIQNTLALENGVYNLQLRELDNYTSHIDQVRLYAVDGEGEWHLCPLTYAYYNELGKVKQILRFDDDSRVDLKPTEVIDLKFAQLGCETAYFIFEINGYNGKPYHK